MTGKRHPFHATWEVGFDEGNRIRALKATLTSDGGWSLDLSEPVLARALCHIDNAYWIPDIEVHGRIGKTNKTSQTAFRGFGGPQGMIVIEDILGRCAPQLGVSPEELRRINFYEADQPTPYGQPVRHAERLAAIWETLEDKADVAARRAGIAEFNTAHTDVKRAMAMTPVKFGISFNLTAFNQAGALVHVYKDGSVLINHGGVEMGQGLHTKMIQVAATALGVPLDYVRLAPTRTDKVPNTSATAASSGADINGGAVKNACDQIRERLARVAAGQLGIHPDDVRFVDGMITGIGFHDQQLAWAQLVHDAYYQRVQLWAAGFYRTTGLHWDANRMQGEPFKYFAYGAACAEVEVDGFTGAYRLRRADIVHDVGDSLSPLDRRRADRGRVRAGHRLAHPGGVALGHQRRAQPRPVEHPGGQHVQDPELLGDARGVPRVPVRAGHRVRRGVRVQGGRRAAADGGVRRPGGAAGRRRRVRPGRLLGRPGQPGHPGSGLLGHRCRPVGRAAWRDPVRWLTGR